MRGTYLLMTALPLEQRPDNSLDNMFLLKPNKLYLLHTFFKSKRFVSLQTKPKGDKELSNYILILKKKELVCCVELFMNSLEFVIRARSGG